MKSKGYTDPYDMEPLEYKKISTKEDPNVVLTLEDHRLIGCMCSPDQHHINYMYVALGETKRCECGHWFTCKEREIPDLTEYGFAPPSKDHH